MNEFVCEENDTLVLYNKDQIQKKFYPGFNLSTGYSGDIELNIYPLYRDTIPSNSDLRKKLIVKPLEKIGSSYVLHYDTVDLSEDELEIATENEWEKVRYRRNNEIASTDWRITKASDTGIPVSEEWVTYRQDLRDVTIQDNPFEIIWPVVPE